MRIIANKKDYYDCIMGCAQDRSVLYVREPEEIYFDGTWPFPRLWANWGDVVIIGFCGKIYPMIEMRHTVYQGKHQHPILSRCYSMDEIDAFADELPNH
jgi:hypothetical protein